jgi:eukaryotic-like serine/threonine-protein kinase
MDLATGTRLGPYEILSAIGAGGMGEVYLARDTRLDRKVAIKLLPAEFTTDEVRVRRFEREAKAASALNHPNIITIYDIGHADRLHYIATEYIEGQTLREHIEHQRINLRETLDIAIQIASALSAAHQAGIIHRDVKPDNVMLRPDGYVKVLDFGLVKLSEKDTISSGTATSTISNTTEPGTVIGTVRYMSPEQARGKAVDGRTDIFSLGVMLYEMITGCAPFEGESVADIIAAILQTRPLPLSTYSPEAPDELQRILSKALRKDSNERYDTMNDLLVDLKNLRDDLHLQAKLGGSIAKNSVSTYVNQETRTVAVGTSQPIITRSRDSLFPLITSSTESVVSQIKTHKRFAIIGMILVVIGTTALLYFNRGPVLTEQDTILLADFVNTTGDPIFDGTLKQGLAVQLAQSPFLHLFPDARVSHTLKLMGRSPDERVTVAIGREICERQGLKALIAGRIASLGSNYVISLEAINGRTGDVLTSEQQEAESKEQVLKALSRSVSRLREKLGESLGSIQKFDAPLEATTSSLDALKAFSLGVERTQSGGSLEAISSFKRAIDLDPQFAYAYGTLAVNYYNTGQPKRAAQYAERAFALQDRLSELEKLRITSFYYAIVTGEIDKSIQVVELYKRSYPRDERGFLNLSDRYGSIGQFEKSVIEAQQALGLNPNNAIAYWDLADALTHLSRFAEAKDICEQAINQNLHSTAVHFFLYEIGFMEGSADAMQQQVNWSSEKPDSYAALDWQNASLAFAGQWRRAEDFSRRSIDLAGRSEANGVAARYAAEAALRCAVFGLCDKTKDFAERSLAFERNAASLSRCALALAICGEGGKAQTLVDELQKSYSKNTVVNRLWLPTVKAALEMQRHNFSDAVQSLDAARLYEPVGEFWPQYLRGQAYLSLKSGKEAAAEFQKILDHRGESTLSVLYPLAHLGLARAALLTGDAEKSRTQYQSFLQIWKDADSDLPVLIEAKRH